MSDAAGLSFAPHTPVNRRGFMLFFNLGDFVVHPTQPDWGIGQVQSIVGMNVTVNFEHAGKQMINCQVITLTKTDPKRKP
jgi:transcription elongation factor GreA-like protein